MAGCRGCGRQLGWRNKYGWCRSTPACKTQARRAEQAAHPGRRLNNHLKRPALYMLSSSRRRATKACVPHTITLEDIEAVMTDTCPVFGHRIGHTPTGGGPGPWSPCLDRIDPAKGYVPGNIQVISHKANVMKNDASPDELLQFAQWVLADQGISR